MFYDLMQSLQEPLRLDQVGFYVADLRSYRQFVAACPEIESGKYHVLKEWDIVSKAGTGQPNLERLRQYEERLGDPTLHWPLVADRRVSLGRLSTLRQDYRPRFSYDRQLCILEEGLVAFEHFFDAVRPDFVVSFICVTFGEYLAYLFARERGVTFLDLRPTRIKNYVTFGESIFEPSERIKAAYEIYYANEVEDGWTGEARHYIESVRTGHAKYEGVIPSGYLPTVSSSSERSLVQKLLDALREVYAYHFGGLKEDQHAPSWLTSKLYRRLLNPLRAWQVHRSLDSVYIRADQLPGLDYAFFPLHTEPEVTLLVYSRSYLNQIEVARNLAQSLPVGMQLVVKEHPVSVGKRPVSYYRKLLAIPNVRLADPALDSKTLIEPSRLVATIAGSIGLEALLRCKPVVTLGRTPFGYLPHSMTRYVTHLDNLAVEIKDLLANYACDECALVSYVAAVASNSVGVNLYSRLLGRQGVYAVGDDSTTDEAWQRDIQALAQYTIDSLVAFGAQIPIAYQ